MFSTVRNDLSICPVWASIMGLIRSPPHSRTSSMAFDPKEVRPLFETYAVDRLPTVLMYLESICLGERTQSPRPTMIPVLRRASHRLCHRELQVVMEKIESPWILKSLSELKLVIQRIFSIICAPHGLSLQVLARCGFSFASASYFSSPTRSCSRLQFRTIVRPIRNGVDGCGNRFGRLDSLLTGRYRCRGHSRHFLHGSSFSTGIIVFLSFSAFGRNAPAHNL